MSFWGCFANRSLKEEVVYLNGEKGGPGNTPKHSEYYIQIFSEFLCKTCCSVLKMLTFSFVGLSFLPSPSQGVLYCLQLLLALHYVSSA